MRLPRTNLTPAQIADLEQGAAPDGLQSSTSGAGSLEKLREMASKMRQSEGATDWENHFFLAPNVRFTRTPERVFLTADAGSLDAEAAKAIESSAGGVVAPAAPRVLPEPVQTEIQPAPPVVAKTPAPAAQPSRPPLLAPQIRAARAAAAERQAQAAAQAIDAPVVPTPAPAPKPAPVLRAPVAPTIKLTSAEQSGDAEFQTAMLLTGRMDAPTYGAEPKIEIRPTATPLKITPVEPAQSAPSPVFASGPLTAMSHLSDFAFWEALEQEEDTLAPPPVIYAELRPIAKPVHAPVQRQPLRIEPAAQQATAPEVRVAPMQPALSMRPANGAPASVALSALQAAVDPLAASGLALKPVEAPAAEAVPKMAFPWARGARSAASAVAPSPVQAPIVAAQAISPAPVAIVPAPVIVEDMIEPPAPQRPAMPQKALSPVRPSGGIPVAMPFSIEAIGFSRAADGSYEFPPRELLQDPPEQQGFVMSQEQLERNAGLLESVLEDFGIRGEIIHVRPGPVVTLYEFEPAPGVKSSRVIGLADDIARSMSALSARVAVVPGRNVIGIELPNATRETVYFSELIDSQDFSKTGFKLPLCLGKTIGGEPVIAELAKMPHLLVAGTTGSGKSVAINTMILSLIYRLKPEECRLIMVDPKMLELSVYDGIPHLLTPVVTDPKKAVLALKWAVREMEERYRKMSRLGVRNIDGYNARAAQARATGETVSHTVQTGFEKGTGEAIHETRDMDLSPMPYIVVIVDEMADLMMVAGKEIEGAIQRLAQMARAAGIHLIMATQRPSVDVITGTIKANFPTRISFQVTSKIDSRTILGEQGAEQLLGQGDMLHMAGGGRIVRVHGPFVSDEEVEKVVSHLKCQGKPDYLDTVTTDEEDDGEAEQDQAVFDKTDMGGDDGDLYDKAVKVVLRDKKCSTSYIQRRLGIGYNRAASLVERMEKEGLVGAANHVGKREIISQRDQAPVAEEE
ncbi:S-DNA-T family DNA segregation ATPase FtsK/SpoIIIE [Rhizobium sp. SG_E_25_P2]|uniref:DNA translocase FtsK n=1 Tax=Rhizobium sp. SG_E_25_P2 TaxID=2879942 RepID=UPI002476D02E|nr:DNA translocase FtsK [Rhizobium sp. SG_E_25_P2]MDH6267520.1 S-DNA-T family DNA segregation ATPase FtsK/SpoIIIE [Rhizobium sp. SG_E_25_P2]